jgi:hypothetical protein
MRLAVGIRCQQEETGRGNKVARKKEKPDRPPPISACGEVVSPGKICITADDITLTNWPYFPSGKNCIQALIPSSSE